MAYGTTIGRATDNYKDVRQNYRTPKDLFQQLNDIFHFTIDACASPENALIPRYWTKEEDCRKQDWSEEVVYCNPPFGMAKDILPKAKTAKTAVVTLPVLSLTTRYHKTSAAEMIAVPGYRIPFEFPPEIGHNKKSIPSMGTVLLFYGEVTLDQIDKLKQLKFVVYRIP